MAVAQARVDLARFPLARAPREMVGVLRREVRQGVRAGIRIVDREVKSRTPVDTRSLLRGFFTRVTIEGVDRSLVVGRQFNRVSYYPFVERGRRPGSMPPPNALRGWAQRKLGNADLAFVVARAIGRRGIPGRFMVRDGWAVSRNRVRNRIQRAFVRGVREIQRAA